MSGVKKILTGTLTPSNSDAALQTDSVPADELDVALKGARAALLMGSKSVGVAAKGALDDDAANGPQSTEAPDKSRNAILPEPPTDSGVFLAPLQPQAPIASEAEGGNPSFEGELVDSGKQSVVILKNADVNINEGRASVPTSTGPVVVSSPLASQGPQDDSTNDVSLANNEVSPAEPSKDAVIKVDPDTTGSTSTLLAFRYDSPGKRESERQHPEQQEKELQGAQQTQRPQQPLRQQGLLPSTGRFLADAFATNPVRFTVIALSTLGAIVTLTASFAPRRDSSHLTASTVDTATSMPSVSMSISSTVGSEASSKPFGQNSVQINNPQQENPTSDQESLKDEIGEIAKLDDLNRLVKAKGFEAFPQLTPESFINPSTGQRLSALELVRDPEKSNQLVWKPTNEKFSSKDIAGVPVVIGIYDTPQPELTIISRVNTAKMSLYEDSRWVFVPGTENEGSFENNGDQGAENDGGENGANDKVVSYLYRVPFGTNDQEKSFWKAQNQKKQTPFFERILRKNGYPITVFMTWQE